MDNKVEILGQFKIKYFVMYVPKDKNNFAHAYLTHEIIVNHKDFFAFGEGPISLNDIINKYGTGEIDQEHLKICYPDLNINDWHKCKYKNVD